LNKLIQELKSQYNTLKTQMELKNGEINSIKKEYEKYIAKKDKKISQLQKVVNQSLYSYNSGLNNIKIANELDNEVKVLMKRNKIQENVKNNDK
jgi:hypothetical protein